MVFNGNPVPGAVVTASQGSRKFVAISNADGVCSFPGLKEGMWTFHVQMTGFQPVTERVSITPKMQPVSWQLKLLTLSEIYARISTAALPPVPEKAESEAKAANTPSSSESEADEALEERAMNGLLINGSVNNAATSPFAQIPAFGNDRRAGHWLQRRVGCDLR